MRRRKLVGRKGKPEAYYFPPQYNQLENNFPYTFMGLEPGTTKDDVRRCLENWNKGDNGILYLSRAFKLQPGTRLADRSRHPARAGLARHLRTAGHQRRLRDVSVDGRRACHRLAPADQRRAGGEPPRSRLPRRACSTGTRTWTTSSRRHNRVFPIAVRPFAETEPQGFREQWVCYGTGWYSAKELTVFPKRT